MSKSITIQYLPKGTTKEQIQAIRNKFKATHSSDCRLILYISGQECMKTSLQGFLSARKV